MRVPGRHPPRRRVGIDTVQAPYSLQMENPGSGETTVETYASMPAVVARAAQLIQAGYSIGIWSSALIEGTDMGDGDERLPADPGEEPAWFIAVAADLCATVLLNGRAFGRFAMLMDDLAEAAGRPRTEVEAAIACGIEQDWLRHDTAYVELRAAGIHVAKEMLGLPREVAH
jgi:hypothetical protein